MTLKHGIIVSKLLICFLLTISRIHAQNLSFSAQISNNNVTSACATIGITFTNTSNIAASSLKWDFGDGYTVSNINSISHSFTNNGTYTVQLFNTSTNEVVKKNFTIFKNPTSSFTSSDTSTCLGNTITLTSTSTLGDASIKSYQWTFGDGTGATSIAGTVDKLYSLVGKFSPALVIVDNNGCTSSNTLKKPIVINGSNVTPSFLANGTLYYSCNNSIQYTNTSTVNSPSTISYTWDLGDGTTITDKDIPSHTYINEGIYTVKLKAESDGVSCAPTFSKTIYIGKPTLSINVADSVCESTSFPLNVSSNLNGFVNSQYDVKWDLSNGYVTNGNTSGIYNSSGLQTVTVTNYNGCPNPTTKTIFVNPLPNLNLSITPSSGICLETKINASVSVANNVPVKDYLWYPEGENAGIKGNSTNPNFNYQYSLPSSYAFTVKATSNNGCYASQSLPVAVLNDCIDNGYGSAYNPYFSFTSQSCANKYTITLKNKYTGSNIDHWVYNGVSYYPNANGEGTITLTPQIKNTVYSIRSIYANGLIDSSRKIVIIDETANFDITNNDNAQLYCATNTFTFNSEPYVNSGNIAKYQWQIKNNAGSIIYESSLPIFSFAIPTADIYTITLTTTDITTNACTTTQTKSINVQGIVSDFTASNTSFCKSGNVLFTSNITSGTPISKLVWSFGDNTPDSTVQTTNTNYSLNHGFTSPEGFRFYDISLIVTDQKGCTSTMTKPAYIHVYNPKASFSAPDTLNCTNRAISIFNTSNARNGNYYWKVGDVENTLDYRTFQYTFQNVTIPSFYDVYLKVTDEGGCTSDTTIKNYIKFVTPSASFKILNQELLSTCPPYTLKILNTSQYSDSTFWSINNEFSSIQPDTIVYSVLHPGPLEVNLTSTLDGCQSNYSVLDTILGPIASLSLKDTIGCAPYISKIVVAHNEDVVSYQWNLGDSSFLSTTIDETSYTYKTKGVYNPFVVVTGQEGCSDKLEYPNPVIVGDPTASIKIADSIKFCYYDSLKFLNISEEEDSLFRFRSFTWHWGNTTELNNSTDTIKHLFQQSGAPYNVYVTGVTDYCSKNSDTLLIQPFLVPQISIGGAPNTCLNDSLRLFGIVSNTENANNLYTWSYDSTAIKSSKDSALVTTINQSQTQIHLKVSTEKGCVSTVSQALGYWNFPTIAIDSADSFCTGSSIQLQAHSNGTQYIWTSAKSISGANSLTPLITPDSSTYYYLTVSDLNNCKNHDSIYVKVDQKVNLKYVNSFEFCLNDTVPLILKTQTDNVSHFTWTSVPSNGFMSDTTGASIGVIPAETTTYHVIAYSGSTCPDESGDILVKGLPFSTVTFDPHLIESSAGTYLTLNPLVTNEELGVKYFWTPNTRLNNPYLKNPDILTDNNIVYKLVIKNDNGCTASDTIAINVKCTESKILMANAFTPNGDGTNDRFYVTGYGIKNVDHFIIVDRWGKKVFEQNNIAANDISKGWDGKINGHLAAPGTYMYFAQIECSEGNIIPLKGSVVLIR